MGAHEGPKDGAVSTKRKKIGRQKFMKTVDNWAGRAQGMVCSTCVYFVAKKAIATTEGGDTLRGSIGRCRRRCPTMNGFPVVYDTDWCGDHKVDENKI